MSKALEPLIKNAGTAALEKCRHCTQGFRRVDGIHIASQGMGMIPSAPCARVFTVHGGNMTDANKRPWLAYVDGAPIRKQRGDARRFASAKAAYTAALKAAPKRWHP